MQHDQDAKVRRIDPGDHVLVRNFAWLTGEIIQSSIGHSPTIRRTCRAS